MYREYNPNPVGRRVGDCAVGNISYNGDSDFSKAVQGKPIDEVIELIEELVLTLQIANPKLYDAFMRKLG